MLGVYGPGQVGYGGALVESGYGHRLSEAELELNYIVRREAGYYCRLCGKSPTIDQCILHINSLTHLSRLRNAQAMEAPLAHVHPDQRPFTIVRNNVAYCTLCNKEMQESHIWSEQHRKRVARAVDERRRKQAVSRSEFTESAMFEINSFAASPAKGSEAAGLGANGHVQRLQDSPGRVAVKEAMRSMGPPPPPDEEPPDADKARRTHQEVLRELRIFLPSDEERRQGWLQELQCRSNAWLTTMPEDFWEGEELSF